MTDKSISKEIVAKYVHTGSESPLTTSRAVILFGDNAATYKFALAKTLMELEPSSSVKYEDVGQIFVRHLLSHHQLCPHQFTRGSTKLTDAMDAHLRDEISWDKMFAVAEKSIYTNVLDRFHNIGGGEIDGADQLYSNDKKNKVLVLTENVNQIQENPDLRIQVFNEAEARWRVVEEAWRNKLSPALIYQEEDQKFYTRVKDARVGLRSAVDTLSPYQKGLCFYCGHQLTKEGDHSQDNFAEVDHFIPFSVLKKQPFKGVNPNGVWNLVLSCKACNRGQNGKFDLMPVAKYHERLLQRNRCFAEEHRHAMNYSVLSSLGVSNKQELESQHREIYKHFEILPKWTP